MFADVAGSSRLYKEIGNTEANARIAHTISMMMGEVKAQHGILVKTIGDAVMARFETADQACATAIGMQRTRDTRNGGPPICIGIAWGSAILESGDIFGEVVNDAAAIANVAQAEQILITQSLVDNLNSAGNFHFQQFDQIRLKGSRTSSVIHRLVWELASESLSSTNIMHIKSLQGLHVQQIELDYQGQIIILTEDDMPFVVGRDPHSCGLAVHTDVASRNHFHISHRRGKYVLVDHSTNGTWVQLEYAPEIYLRREELPLRGSGFISLGEPVREPGAHLLRFTCS
jgi:hypothetical protein